MKNTNRSRRDFLRTSFLGGAAVTMPSHAWHRTPEFESLSQESHVIADIRSYTVKVNHRGNWILIELKTSKGITGIGEASHGAASTSEGHNEIQKEIAAFFELVKGTSPFSIEQYRTRGWARAHANKISRTAFSGVEQALWDINGKTLGVPVHQLLGGKVRDKIRTYANINRATNERDSNGRRPAAAFQKNALIALKQGFKALKMAPFDEMKPLPSTSQQIRADIDHAIRCLEAVRETIGNGIDLLVDVHSHLDQPLGIEVARRVEPLNLFWFEEPVNPQKFVLETKAITESTSKTTAGGESIFGREGFAPLIREKALDILMPDVKHCGGILELKYIAAMAETAGLQVAPHNPSGPIATAASVQAVATIPNFAILEMAHGEVPWRNNIIAPQEEFIEGYAIVSDRPGFGFELNLNEVAKHT